MEEKIIFSITESDFNNVFNSYYPFIKEDERERIIDTFIKAQDVEWESEIRQFIEYELNK